MVVPYFLFVAIMAANSSNPPPPFGSGYYRAPYWAAVSHYVGHTSQGRRQCSC